MGSMTPPYGVLPNNLLLPVVREMGGLLTAEQLSRPTSEVVRNLYEKLVVWLLDVSECVAFQIVLSEVGWGRLRTHMLNPQRHTRTLESAPWVMPQGGAAAARFRGHRCAGGCGAL